VSIVHRDDMNRFASDGHASYLVVVRADRAPVAACDIAIAQNALKLAPNERFIPLWPQPGLVPRDPSRGTRVERIAYHGRTGTAPAWFGDPGFRRDLERRGLRFDVRESEWERYDDVDVALAIREELPGVLATKPATKIYNGWLSRVAVLAAPEPAYREVAARLDFLEVNDDATCSRRWISCANLRSTRRWSPTAGREASSSTSRRSALDGWRSSTRKWFPHSSARAPGSRRASRGSSRRWRARRSRAACIARASPTSTSPGCALPQPDAHGFASSASQRARSTVSSASLVSSRTFIAFTSTLRSW
jgi:hypothetical protein